jgi:hypothetical protein
MKTFLPNVTGFRLDRAGAGFLLVIALGLAARPADAQGVTYFMVSKGQVLSQTTPAAPAPLAAGGFTLVAAAPDFGGAPLATGASVTLPGGAIETMTDVTNDSAYEFRAAADSQTDLDATYPAGDYTVSVVTSLLGTVSPNIDLPSEAYPTIPQIANFTAAQSVDSTMDFAVSYSAFLNPGQYDDGYIEIDDGGAAIYTDSLDLTATAYTIPANTLVNGKTYRVLVRFRSLQVSYLTSAVSAYAFYNDNWFPLTTVPGVSPNAPPTLANVEPANGGELRDFEQPVVFDFSKEMNPANVAINWTATVNGQAIAISPGAFYYDWSSPSNLACFYALGSNGWPAGAVVSWTLSPTAGSPSNFVDSLGNPLAIGANSGSFLAAGGPWNCPAQTNAPLEAPAFYLSTAADYTQASAAGPSPDPSNGAEANFYYRLPGGLSALLYGGAPIVAVSVPLAGVATNGARGIYVELPLLAHLSQGVADYYYYQYNAALPDPGNLDGAYPSGSYELQLSGLNPANIDSPFIVTNSVTLTVTNQNFPPAPRFVNYAAAQTLNISNDFALQWAPYAGADTNSFVLLQIQDASGSLIFTAPDSCAGIPLSAASTGVTIPADTMTAGNSYTVTLLFGSVVSSGASMPGVPGQGYSAIESRTRMALTINALGYAQSPPAVSIVGPLDNTVLPSGNVAIQFSASDPGAALASAQLFNGTNLLATLPIPGGQSNYTGAISGVFGDGPQTATIVVTDANGLTASSSSLNFMTQDPAFVVSITSPVGGGSYSPVAGIVVSATAVSPGGPITNIDFYMDGSWIGNAATAPFAVPVPPPGFGPHTFYAQAEDTNGFAGISPVVTATVPIPAPGSFVSGFEPDGLFHAAFAGSSGTNYVLQMTTNLTPPAVWANVQNRILTRGAADFFDLQSGSDAMRFYRMVPGGVAGSNIPSFSVASAVDLSRGTNGICDDTGLVATFADDNETAYTLTLAPASLGELGFAEVDLASVTNLAGYPLSGAMLAAVEMAPVETPVLPGGSLTIQLTNAIATNELVAFSYHAPSGEFFLVPFQAAASPAGVTVTIPVTRLGGYGVASLRSADLALQNAYPPSNPDDRTAQYAAWAVLEQEGLTVPPISFVRAQPAAARPPSHTARGGGSGAAQALLGVLNNVVLPNLEAADLPIGSGGPSPSIAAGLAGYQSFYAELSACGYADNASFAPLLAQANKASIDMVQNLANYSIGTAQQNDMLGMLNLQSYGLALIDAQPWGNSWPPGARQALLAKLELALSFTVSLESLVEQVGLDSKVRTDYQANNIIFSVGNPDESGEAKGSGPAVFHSLSYVSGPGCTDFIPNPFVPNFTVFEFGFFTRQQGRSRGGGAQVAITGVRFVFGIGTPLENYQFRCADSGIQQVSSYWYPRFATDHKAEFSVYPRGGNTPTPAFYFNNGWQVYRQGTAQVASKSLQIPAGPDLETTVITITHTPL